MKPAGTPADTQAGRGLSLPATLLRHTLLRFLVVGVLNTGFSYSVYAVCVFLGLDYKAASLVSLLLGIAFSFKTQGGLVFGNTDPRLFVRFLLAWLVIYLINIGLIGGLMRLGLNAYGAGVLALLPVALMSYVVQRWFVFGRKSPARIDPGQIDAE